MNFKLCHTCEYEHSRLCCSGCEQDNDEYVQAEWFTKKEAEIRADERQKVFDRILNNVALPKSARELIEEMKGRVE